MHGRFQRYRLLWALVYVYLTLSFLLRITLWWQFGATGEVNIGQLPLILLIGIVNDAVQLVYLMFPMGVFLLVLPERLFQSKINYMLLFIGSYLAVFGMFYLTVVEYYFFEEFNARFNLVAVDYLIYPHEVLIDIWEAYPVVWVMLIDAVLSAFVVMWLWRGVRPQLAITSEWQCRLISFGGHTILLLLAIMFFSTRTLSFTHNRVTQELTHNGMSSFFEALRTNELEYNLYYRTADSTALFHLLTTELAKGGGTLTHLEESRLDRQFSVNPQGLGQLNVVIVVEESFGSEFVGTLGDTRGLTPEFDKLAKQGILFTNAYATGTRTVRGLEAITASFPPIPSESIVKRPGSENITTLGKVLRDHGYHTSFLYGGYGYFDNMNYFYKNNGFATRDRSDIPNPHFANIWGVSDEDLFNQALVYFDNLHAQSKPFLSIIMTTSNHKPFTFPEGIPNILPAGGGRDAGIRYADYALGKLLREAVTHPWYANTLFVVVADHGARVYGKAEIPLYSYEIPLLLLAPQHLQPRVVDTPISQIDIAPTVLGLLGFAYEAPFFGQNALAQTNTSPVLLFNHNYDVALFKDNELAVLGLMGNAQNYRYERATRSFAPLAPDSKLTDLATAYYQIAFELFKMHRY